MRRLLFILLTLLPCIAHAQEFDPDVWVDEALLMGYNRSYGLYGADDTVIGLDEYNYQMLAGIRIHSHHKAAHLGGTWFFHSGCHRFGVEAFCLAQWGSNYSVNDFCAGILGRWSWLGRVEVRAGTFFRAFVPARGTGSLWEPFNGAYSVSFWAREANKKFNIGASLSNLDYFTAERFFCPMVSLQVNWRVSDMCTIYLKLREHNSGIFDLTNNTFDHQIRIGTLVKW